MVSVVTSTPGASSSAHQPASTGERPDLASDSMRGFAIGCPGRRSALIAASTPSVSLSRIDLIGTSTGKRRPPTREALRGLRGQRVHLDVVGLLWRRLGTEDRQERNH